MLCWKLITLIQEGLVQIYQIVYFNIDLFDQGNILSFMLAEFFIVEIAFDSHANLVTLTK